MSFRWLSMSAASAAATRSWWAAPLCHPLPPKQLMPAPALVTLAGNVAGEATDFVFMLIPDGNPATPGLALRATGSLLLSMLSAFKWNAATPVSACTDASLVLTKG